MILINIYGGLGNQLFQYALGKHLAILKNTELKLDTISCVNHKYYRKYELSHFNVTENFASEREIAKFQKYKRKPGKKWFLYNRLIANPKKYFQEEQYHFSDTVFGISDDCYVTGYWQTEKYFEGIAPLIRKEFTVKTPLSGKNALTAKEIRASHSVMVHIRRGDHVDNKEIRDYHGLCGLDYYTKAMEIMSEKVCDPHFFIFSDDQEWAKDNIRSEYPVTFVDNNTVDEGFEDIRLMSFCSHAIISNSSFSWWGAWLIPDIKKTVIAPRRWFNNIKPSVITTDVIPESWEKI